MVQTIRRTTELPPLLDTVFDVLAAQVVQDFVMVQRQMPMVCSADLMVRSVWMTIVIPQLRVDR